MSRLRYIALLLLLSACSTSPTQQYTSSVSLPAEPGWFYVLSKPGFPDLHVGPYPWQNTPSHGLAICRDWLGSMGCAHGNQCLPHPSPTNCACMSSGCALGIAASVGATASADCSQMPDVGVARGFYCVDQQLQLHGPYNKAQAMRFCPAPAPRRSYAFGIGKIGNTEGSNGGP